MNQQKTPNHVAIIMDGNRRWAKNRKLSIFMGHSKGAKRLDEIVEHAGNRGIRYITFWAFSTENWNRGEEEVSLLIRVFREFLGGSLAKKLKEKGGRLVVIGDYFVFPKDITQRVEAFIQDTKNNTGISVIIGLNYGGRDEILRAVRKALKENRKELTEEVFSEYLFTKDIPDPDLIVRTGGEMRLSGFLPWQSVYSELYFTKTFWPDFGEKEFEKALKDYNRRQRRFGE